MSGELVDLLLRGVAALCRELFVHIVGAYLYDRAEKPHRARTLRADSGRFRVGSGDVTLALSGVQATGEVGTVGVG
jgi:hypothetical protein